MMMISDLPRDLVSEVLSRVPMKTMKEVRLTCTNWNTLTKSEIFAKMHIRKGAATREGESQMIVMRDDNLCLVSVFVNGPSIQFIGKRTCLNEQVKISQVFYCEGLLLCKLKEDDTKVVVWNPYWGQTRSIQCRFYHCLDKYDSFSYALGYEDKKSCLSHKFLRFIDKYPFGPPEVQYFWYEIYDFDSGLWRTLDVTPYSHIPFDSRGVSLRGHTYWLASERKPSQVSRIICFDFTSESFGPLLRLPFDVQCACNVILSCVREEKLAVLHQHVSVTHTELVIWITTKIEAENISWSKFFTLNAELVYPFLYYFFIDEEKKATIGIYRETWDHDIFSTIGEGGYFQSLDLGEDGNNRSWRVNLCSYVPSLVQIKQSAGAKLKNQNDLQKRLFDENMSRLFAVEKRIRLRHKLPLGRRVGFICKGIKRKRDH